MTTIKFIDKFKCLFDKSKRYVLLYGGRGGGKSQAVARALILQGLNEKYLILCTREKQNSINESVYSLLKNIIFEYQEEGIINKNFFNIKADEIEFKNGTRFIFKGLSNMTKDNIKSLEGVDICWVEEASSITKITLDVLLPTIRKEHSRIFFTYNRNTMFDPVHETLALNPSENTVVQEINYYDNPFFPKVLEEERLRCKENETEEVYRHIWLGEPYVEEAVLIPMELLKKNMNFKSENYKRFDVVMGVDVATSEGSDYSVLLMRQGNKILDIIKFKGLDGRDLAEKIMIYRQRYNVKHILIDAIGVGASPCDFLRREFKCPFIGVKFGEKAEDVKYFNKRTESYMRVRKALEEGFDFGNRNQNIDILIQQLQYIPFDIQTSDKIKIKKKEDIKKMLGCSPDVADAFALTYSYFINDFNSKVSSYRNNYEPRIEY